MSIIRTNIENARTIVSSNPVLPANTAIGNVSSTELSYLDGVTSGIQSQLNSKTNISSGVPFNMKFFSNTTRTGLSAVNNFELWTVTYNKTSATSTIIAQINLHFREPYNGEVGFFIRLGTSGQRFTGCSYMESGGTTATDPAADGKQVFQSLISNYTITGNQTFALGWNSLNGSANMPSSIWNPTSTDENRSRNPGSTMLIWEVEI